MTSRRNTREAEAEASYRCPDTVLRAAQALRSALLDAIEAGECSAYVVAVTEQDIRIQGRGRLSGGDESLRGGLRYETVEADGVVQIGVTELVRSSCSYCSRPSS